MLSAFISSIRSYPAMHLAVQLVHQRYVHPGPLVLRTAPFKSPTPATDRDRLQEKFGTKVAIKANEKTGKGKIEINYLSTEDFNRILDVLNIEL